MASPAAELAHRLAREAEAVCRHYLSNGRRCGRYWIIGDVANTPGRSLYVRLNGPVSGKGAAGKWVDAATGQRGDLVDLIRLSRGLDGLSAALTEARAFLALPRAQPAERWCARIAEPTSSEAARRLFKAGRPIAGPARELARTPRCNHRPEWRDHGRSPHLARPGRIAQGAAC